MPETSSANQQSEHLVRRRSLMALTTGLVAAEGLGAGQWLRRPHVAEAAVAAPIQGAMPKAAVAEGLSVSRVGDTQCYYDGYPMCHR